MKKIYQFVIITLGLASLISCTSNNGDIGDWFGTWRIETITVDGEPEVGYDSNITMAFQGNIVSITEEGEHHDYAQMFGTWESDVSTLTLDFSHASAPVTESQQWQFVAPKALHINRQGITIINIIERSPRRLTTSFVDSEGQSVGYIMTKSV